MATTIESTYSLDVESERALEPLARRWRVSEPLARRWRVSEPLARRWRVSQSEALRRAIRSEAARGPDRRRDALAALDELQASLRSRNVDVEEWAREVEAGRRRA